MNNTLLTVIVEKSRINVRNYKHGGITIMKRIVIKKRVILLILILISLLICMCVRTSDGESIFSIVGKETTKALSGTSTTITIDWGEGTHGNITGLYAASNNSVKAIIDGEPRWDVSMTTSSGGLVKASDSDFLGLFTDDGVQVIAKDGTLCQAYTMRNISC